MFFLTSVCVALNSFWEYRLAILRSMHCFPANWLVSTQNSWSMVNATWPESFQVPRPTFRWIWTNRISKCTLFTAKVHIHHSYLPLHHFLSCFDLMYSAFILLCRVHFFILWKIRKSLLKVHEARSKPEQRSCCSVMSSFPSQLNLQYVDSAVLQYICDSGHPCYNLLKTVTQF